MVALHRTLPTTLGHKIRLDPTPNKKSTCGAPVAFFASFGIELSSDGGKNSKRAANPRDCL